MNDFRQAKSDETAWPARDAAFARIVRFEENTPGLMSYATTQGQPFWLVVRWHLCRLAQDRTQRTETSTLRFPRRYSVGIKLRFAWAALRDLVAAAAARPSKIVFVCTGGGASALTPTGYVNRLTDCFASCFPEDTLLLERPHELRYNRPRAFSRSAGWGGLQLLESLAGRFGRLPAAQVRVIEHFMVQLRTEFSDLVTEKEWLWMHGRCVRFSRSEAGSLALYRRLLARLAPRVLFIEDAHYGGMAHLVLAARQQSVPVAEFQHGLVSINHEAYNYAPELLARGYHRFLPDYFLVYGDYWRDCIATSARVVVIGNPHLSERVQAMAGGEKAEVEILFVSSAMDSDRYMYVMQDLIAVGLRVAFRPHPVERSRLAEVYGDFFAREGICVDTGADALAALAAHRVVVGDISTALFEAIALGCQVFAIDSPATRTHVGRLLPIFTTGADLRELLVDPATAGPRADRVWAQGWESRYRAWMAELAPEAVWHLRELSA